MMKIERLSAAVDDCAHCPARGVPCLVQRVYVREQGHEVLEVRVSGKVTLCWACLARAKASAGEAEVHRAANGTEAA